MLMAYLQKSILHANILVVRLVLPVYILRINDLRKYVEIKCQLDAADEFLLQILLLAQHVSGTFMPIIRSKPDTQPSTPHCTDNLKTNTKYDRQQPLV
jgi:hypothetical protein